MRRAARSDAGSSRAWLAATLALLSLRAALAQAAPQASATADVFASGGYDSNLFLLVAADPDSPTYRSYAGGFLRVAPGGALALAGDDLRLELRGSADVRQTFGSGTLFLEDAQLTLIQPELGPFDLRVGVSGGRFDATVDEALRFSSLGGSLEATWRLFERWRFTATYRLLGRWFGAPDRIGVVRDLAQDVELRSLFSAGPGTRVALSIGYVDLRSNLSEAATGAAGVTGQFDRFWVGLDGVHVPAPGVTLFASLWAGAMRPDGGPADLQVGGAAAVSKSLGKSVDAVLRYEGLIDRRSASSTEASDFQRHVVTAGLQWRGATSRRPPPPVLPADESPTVVDGRVRFTFKAPRATSVAVVGSWNDWARDVPAQGLRPGPEPGAWEARLALPPGTYRFQFLVDGRAVSPPAAVRHADDGFGGQDGIVEIRDGP